MRPAAVDGAPRHACPPRICTAPGRRCCDSSRASASGLGGRRRATCGPAAPRRPADCGLRIEKVGPTEPALWSCASRSALRTPRSALGWVPGIVDVLVPRGLIARLGSLGQVAGGVVLGADPRGLALPLGDGRLVGAVGVVVVGVDLVDLVVGAGLLERLVAPTAVENIGSVPLPSKHHRPKRNRRTRPMRPRNAWSRPSTPTTSGTWT
jgi:hypothetical protein